MVSRDHNFRVGQFDIDGEISLPGLTERLNDQPFIGDRGSRRGVRKVNYSERHHLVYFVFIKEIEDEITTLNIENEDVEESVYPRRSMKMIMGSQGAYVYESVQGISDMEAIDFSPTSRYTEGIEHRSLDRRTMLDFFNNRLYCVRKFKVDDIGERQPNPGPIRTEIKRIVSAYGEVIDNSEHSVGRDKDARENELAYGIAETSDLQRVRGEDEEGRIEELTKSGIYRIRYDDDENMTAEEEATFIVNKISGMFERFFRD